MKIDIDQLNEKKTQRRVGFFYVRNRGTLAMPYNLGVAFGFAFALGVIVIVAAWLCLLPSYLLADFLTMGQEEIAEDESQRAKFRGDDLITPTAMARATLKARSDAEEKLKP